MVNKMGEGLQGAAWTVGPADCGVAAQPPRCVLRLADKPVWDTAGSPVSPATCAFIGAVG